MTTSLGYGNIFDVAQGSFIPRKANLGGQGQPETIFCEIQCTGGVQLRVGSFYKKTSYSAMALAAGGLVVSIWQLKFAAFFSSKIYISECRSVAVHRSAGRPIMKSEE